MLNASNVLSYTASFTTDFSLIVRIIASLLEPRFCCEHPSLSFIILMK